MTEYEQDAAGRITRTLRYKDARPSVPGEEIEILSDDRTAHVELPEGRREEFTDGFGKKNTWDYDAAGRLARRETRDSSGTLQALSTYLYDELGRKEMEVESSLQDGEMKSVTRTYGYDALGNL